MEGGLQIIGDKSPDLSEVTVSYLNQNLPPQVRSVSAIAAGDRSSPSSPASSGSSNITVTVSGSSSASSLGAGKGVAIISWQADDPNGDQLTYSLYVRGDDEQEWHLLKEDLRQTNYTIEPSTVADGKYVARVVASDRPSNPSSLARQAELASAPFWVDNSPPTVTLVRTEVNSTGVEIQFLVQDTVSPVRSAEVSVNGKDWLDAHSDDGIVDSKTETFTLRPGQLGPGEHLVLLRAFDAAGNAGVGKAVVRMTAGTALSR